MTKSQNDKKGVLIFVRPGKRGYLVEVAGSDQPYPCLEASDIGDAVIEILDDPDQSFAEFTSPTIDAKKATTRTEPMVEEEAEAHEELDDFDAGEPRRDGWSAGDELIVGLIGNGVSKMREFSKWRKG